MNWIVLALGFIIAAGAVYIVWLLREQRKQDSVIDQKTSVIDNLFSQVSELSQKATGYHKRIIQLEDGIEKSFGVTVRQEVTEVNTDFSKVEWVVMLAGVHKLLSGSKNADDAKIYIELIEKIQSFMDDLKEDTEAVT